MRFLTLRIPGKYLDAFLYRGHLYLLTRENTLRIVHWDRVLARVFPGRTPDEVDPLAQLLFGNNGLAHSDRRLLSWVGYAPFLELLRSRMKSFENVVIAPEASEWHEYGLGAHSVHTIEMYYSHVWLVGEDGVSYVQAGPGKKRGGISRQYRVTEGRAFGVSAERKTLLVLGATDVHVVPIDVDSRHVTVDIGDPSIIASSASAAGWHWGDVVLASGDHWSSQVFVQQVTERTGRENDRTLAERDRAIREFGTGVTIQGGSDILHEVELQVAKSQRLYCSRERLVGHSQDHTVQGFEWSYGLDVAQNGLADFKTRAEPERVLVSTFGWVVEEREKIDVTWRSGTHAIHRGEAVQVRVFPAAYYYENIVALVLDEEVQLIAVPDYDFLFPPDQREMSIGRTSDYFTQRAMRLRMQR